MLSQAVRQCLAAHPAAGEWRAAAAAALHLGRAFPEAVAAMVLELLPGAARLGGGGAGGGGSGSGTAAQALGRQPHEGQGQGQGRALGGEAERGGGASGEGQAGGEAVGEQEEAEAEAVARGLDADVAWRLLLLAGAHGAAPQVVGRGLPGHVTRGLLRAVVRVYGGGEDADA